MPITIGLIQSLDASISFGHYDSIQHLLLIKIDNIVDKILSTHGKCIGLTGLGFGIEQDFCDICIKHKIPYKCVIPHDGFGNKWPEPIKQKYTYLLHNSLEQIYPKKGPYNPLKRKIKENYIRTKSDYIIYIVENPLIQIIVENKINDTLSV